MKVNSIKFPTRFATAQTAARIADAEFQLGPGPCGKTVIRLFCNVQYNGVEIAQYHDDGTSKSFFYPWSQITGRIEVEWVE